MKGECTCLCGANRISWDAEPILKFRCHCTDELRLTGTGFSNNILFPSDTLTIISGNLKQFTKIVDSGNAMTSHICEDCGSLLIRTSSGFPGAFVVKVGTIDDGGEISRGFVPEVEIYTRTRAKWIPSVEGAKQEEAALSRQ